jgi:hypothetical protein
MIPVRSSGRALAYWWRREKKPIIDEKGFLISYDETLPTSVFDRKIQDPADIQWILQR